MFVRIYGGLRAPFVAAGSQVWQETRGAHLHADPVRTILIYERLQISKVGTVEFDLLNLHADESL